MRIFVFMVILMLRHAVTVLQNHLLLLFLSQSLLLSQQYRKILPENSKSILPHPRCSVTNNIWILFLKKLKTFSNLSLSLYVFFLNVLHLLFSKALASLSLCSLHFQRALCATAKSCCNNMHGLGCSNNGCFDRFHADVSQRARRQEGVLTSLFLFSSCSRLAFPPCTQKNKNSDRFKSHACRRLLMCSFSFLS